MTDKINSIKHTEATRLHTPSSEEQGYEQANPKVQSGKQTLEFPVNPVVHRGQDPELFWMNKYGNDDREELLKVDIRSLYRHEHIAPERLIKNLYRVVEDDSPQGDLFVSVNEIFGNALDKDELEKIEDYYSHHDGWTNRLIQGDSHLVMASLLEREGMAGQVQMIYIDPPYGIKYGSNWQIKLNNRDVKDGSDEALTGEPEVIKAFRDTWELGIHSYLSYIRDRLLIAKELLTERGSCFVQISDENVHLVRNVMDEIFGSENFCAQVAFRKTTGKGGALLDNTYDTLLWYAKNKEVVKFNRTYLKRHKSDDNNYRYVELPDGTRRTLTKQELENVDSLNPEWKIFSANPLTSQSSSSTTLFEYEMNGSTYKPGKGGWKTNIQGMRKLEQARRLMGIGNTLRFIRYFDDFPYQTHNDIWDDTRQSGFGDPKLYVVQTALRVAERCLLMTTDPGDLVLDPTCGSGTTAFVAEQFGRRWITTDTSRIALNIAKTRLMTATFPYYKLYDEENGDIRQGFVYKTVPHITLKSLANDEPPATETLYDKPEIDNKRLRVCGAFTVETLQNFEPVAPEDLDDQTGANEQEGAFEETIRQ